MENDPTIYFLRHGKIDLPYASHLDMPYEVLDDLATSRLDPPIAPESCDIFLQVVQNISLNEVGAIYYNNSGRQSRRSFESAKLVARLIQEQNGRDVPIVGTHDCKEVDFNLPALLSKEAFEKGGMPAIRSALYHAEVTGSCVENIEEMFTRIERLFAVLKEHGKTAIVISHDFFMRVIEVYLTTTKNPDEVTVRDLDHTTLSTYFRGFEASINADRYKRFQ